MATSVREKTMRFKIARIGSGGTSSGEVRA